MVGPVNGVLLSIERDDRAVLALTGGDRVRFLHGMVTNDIKRLTTGRGCRAALLSQKGRFVADLVVYARPDELWIETDRSTFDKVAAILEQHIIADDVELEDRRRTLALHAIYAFGGALPIALDPEAPYAIRDHEGLVVAGTRELGVPGLRLFVPTGERANATAGATLARLLATTTPLGKDELEMKRIEAGTPRYGFDMDEERLFLEAGIEDAVSYDKGCYLGQEVVVRAQSRGQLNRRLVGLLFDETHPDAPLPERGAKLASSDRPEAGFVTSTTFSTTLGRQIGLGYVHRTAWTPGTVLQCGSRSATVSALPIVRHA